MDSHRKLWNRQQKLLRQALAQEGDHQRAIELFMSQHAMVHSAQVAESGLYSFEDDIWEGLTEEDARSFPQGCDHSIAWIVWHIARIEDVTMNMLVAGGPQIAVQGGWFAMMKAAARDTGNAMSEEDVAALSATIDIEALGAYRVAVGRRTREIVAGLQPDALRQKVDPARLQQIMVEGAVVEAASDTTAYWGRRTIAGLLLMPPTRHSFIHLNEASRVKEKCR